MAGLIRSDILTNVPANKSGVGVSTSALTADPANPYPGWAGWTPPSADPAPPAAAAPSGWTGWTPRPGGSAAPGTGSAKSPYAERTPYEQYADAWAGHKPAAPAAAPTGSAWGVAGGYTEPQRAEQAEDQAGADAAMAPAPELAPEPKPEPEFAVRRDPERTGQGWESPTPGVAGAFAPEGPKQPFMTPEEWKTWAETPWSEAEAEALRKKKEGELGGEGDTKETFDDTKDELGSTDTATQDIINQILDYGGLADPNLDEYYKNAWEHESENINQQFSGRGLYNSSGALRALAHSRGDLAAQQSKAEADYAMESMKNDVSRLSTAAQLSGDVTERELASWIARLQGASMSDNAELNRVHTRNDDIRLATGGVSGYLADAFKQLFGEDADLVMKMIMDSPAPATNADNTDKTSRDAGTAALVALVKQLYGGGAPTATPAK